MKVKIWVTIAAGIILTACETGVAAEDKIFTSSGQIVDGEVWGNVSIYNDDTIVDMLGGNVDRMTTYDASTLNVTGGHVSTLRASQFSTANVSGGYVYGLDVSGHATANFLNNAGVFAPRACGFGTINMVSGIVDHIGAIDSGTINLFGGIISDYLVALDSSVVNIFGHEIIKTGTGGHYGYGQVYGFWSDGTEFTIDLNGADTYWRINLIAVVEAEVEIWPETVNLASKGKWISCKMWLPEDCNVADVNSRTVLLEDEVPAEWIWFNERQNVVVAKFARSEVQAIIELGEIELTVTGYFTDGSYFVGTDTVKVIGKGDNRK